MICEQSQTLLIDHLYGTLEAKAAAALRAHLASCARCATDLQRLQQARSAVAQLPKLEPSAAWRGRVIAAAGQALEGPRWRRVLQSLIRRPAIAAFATVIIVAGFSLFAYRQGLLSNKPMVDSAELAEGVAAQAADAPAAAPAAEQPSVATLPPAEDLAAVSPKKEAKSFAGSAKGAGLEPQPAPRRRRARAKPRRVRRPAGAVANQARLRARRGLSENEGAPHKLTVGSRRRNSPALAAGRPAQRGGGAVSGLESSIRRDQGSPVDDRGHVLEQRAKAALKAGRCSLALAYYERLVAQQPTKRASARRAMRGCLPQFRRTPRLAKRAERLFGVSKPADREQGQPAATSADEAAPAERE